jgi:hypothetical protein
MEFLDNLSPLNKISLRIRKRNKYTEGRTLKRNSNLTRYANKIVFTKLIWRKDHPLLPSLRQIWNKNFILRRETEMKDENNNNSYALRHREGWSDVIQMNL